LGAAPDSWELEREVGSTAAEFLRCLRQAAPCPVDALDDGCRLRCDGVELTVSTRPLPDRRIAGLVLPVIRVTYRFHGDRAAGAVLLATLDAGMQRGGG
jgi:hypothetical protein